MILFFFVELLFANTIFCNAISLNSIKVENSDYTLACSKLTAQKITSFTVSNSLALNCFDEFLLISFEIIDIRTNRTSQEQAYLTKNGCCLAESQVTSQSCIRIRR